MKTKTIISKQIYPNKELLMVSEEQIQFSSAMEILSEIEKLKVIQFSREVVDENNTRVIAKLKVVIT